MAARRSVPRRAQSPVPLSCGGLGTATKLVLLVLIGLFAVKALSRGRWRGLARRFDRAINVAAALLVVVYGAYALWLLFGGK